MLRGFKCVGGIYNPALNLVDPDIDRPERASHFQHVDQFHRPCDLQFDAIGAGIKEMLGKAELVGMPVDPGDERDGIDVAEDRDPFAQFALS